MAISKDAAKYYLPLVTALTQGKDIQHNTYGNRWDTLKDPSFNTPAHLYRIKPDALIVRTRRAIMQQGKEVWIAVLHDLPDYVSPEQFVKNNRDCFLRWLDNAWVETEV